MDDIQAQLAEYRRAKENERALVTSKSAATSDHAGEGPPQRSVEIPPLLRPLVEWIQEHPVAFGRIILSMKVLAWLTFLYTAVQLDFTAVYMLLTLFYLLYASLSNRSERRPGELSAYSVFNPNFERLLGQTTAEQFETELRRGAGGVGS